MQEYVWISKLAYHPIFTQHVYPVLDKIALEYNVKISIDGPADTSEEEYIQAIYNAVERNVSGIMVIGWGGKKIVKAINAAVEKGIPVITVDSDIPSSKRLAYVGTDWYRMGQTMAQTLADMINGPGKVLMLGMSGLCNMENGFRGFTDMIKKYSDIQLLGPEDDIDTAPKRAEAITTQYLRRYPDLAGIAGFDGNSGPGAAIALEKFLKVKTVKLVCVDVEKQQLEYLRNGAIDAVFAQKREYFTYLAFQMLYSFNHGSVSTGYKPGIMNIPGNIDTGFVVVRKENVDTFEAGFDIEGVMDRQNLAHQVNLFTQMMDSVRDIIVSADLEGRIIYANPSACRTLLYNHERLTSLCLKDIFDFQDKEDLFKRSVLKQEQYNFESEIITRKGTRVPVSVGICRFLGGSGVSGMVITAKDITEQKKSEKLLIDQECGYRILCESAADGILAAEIKTKRFKYVNPSLQKMLGYSNEEFLKMSIADIHSPEELPRVIEEFKAQSEGKKVMAMNIPCLRKDKTVINCDISATIIKDYMGDTDCVVGFFRKSIAPVNCSEKTGKASREKQSDFVKRAMKYKNFSVRKKQWLILLAVSVLGAIGGIIHGVYFDLDFSQIKRLSLFGVLFTSGLVFPAILFFEFIFDLNNQKQMDSLKDQIEHLNDELKAIKTSK